MSETSREGKAASSFLFKLLESFGTQIISLLISIVLGRLLTPTDYGVISMLMVFIAISQVFVQSGLNTALIQKKEVDNEEITSVFSVSLGISFVLYWVLFFAAPAIASFYRMPELVSALRILALILFPGAVVAQEQAVVARRMLFRKSMTSTFVAVVISGLLGIWLAKCGLKYWALVGQQLCYQFSLALLLAIRVGWKPSRHFSIQKVTGLLGFGWRILVSSLLDTGYSQLRTLVIGKRYTEEQLGNYTKGKQFPEIMTTAIGNAVSGVMLPVLSEAQDNAEHMRDILRTTLQVTCAVTFPLMAGLSAVAYPLIGLVLGEKWLGCVVFLQICCLDLAFNPIHTANLQAINAKGRSDIFLKLELVKKSYGIIILLVSVLCFHSVEAIAWGGVLSTILSLIVNAHPNHKLMNYGFDKQLRDILPSFLISLGMGALVLAMGNLPIPRLPLLLTQMAAGLAVYVGLNLLFKVKAFGQLLAFAKGFLHGKTSSSEVNP